MAMVFKQNGQNHDETVCRIRIGGQDNLYCMSCYIISCRDLKKVGTSRGMVQVNKNTKSELEASNTVNVMVVMVSVQYK